MWLARVCVGRLVGRGLEAIELRDGVRRLVVEAQVHPGDRFGAAAAHVVHHHGVLAARADQDERHVAAVLGVEAADGHVEVGDETGA